MVQQLALAADGKVTLAVGIGEMLATGDPESVLMAYGLGSCVGVCLYDRESRVGGLAHVMLPSSSEGHDRSTGGKYADRAIPLLLEGVVKLGGNQRRLVSKIAGGAQMLTGPAFSGNGFNIGERNVEAVKAVLERYRVPLLNSDTGGNRGRTMAMHIASGRVLIRIIGERETEL